MPTNMQIGILSFFLLATVITAAACPGFRNGLRAVAVQCGPDLIKEVAGILVTPDWRATLEARAGAMGLDAINCAVQAVLNSLSEGEPDPHGFRTRFYNMTPIQDRARDWLADHPVKK